MKEWHCVVCGRWIGAYELAPGSSVKTICKRCKAENEVEMQSVEVKRVTVKAGHNAP